VTASGVAAIAALQVVRCGEYEVGTLVIKVFRSEGTRFVGGSVRLRDGNVVVTVVGTLNH
jgi:hypothetical protein